MSFKRVKNEDSFETVNIEHASCVLSQHRMFCVAGHLAGAEA